jgi:hypothetical protein
VAFDGRDNSEWVADDLSLLSYGWGLKKEKRRQRKRDEYVFCMLFL